MLPKLCAEQNYGAAVAFAKTRSSMRPPASAGGERQQASRLLPVLLNRFGPLPFGKEPWWVQMKTADWRAANHERYKLFEKS